MATHSALLPGSTADVFTVEHATVLLTAQLGLVGTDDHRKGKDNGETFLSDADFALRIQAEDLVNAVQVIEDTQSARELEEGFQAGHPHVVNFPPSTAHRHEIALSLLKRSGLLTLSAVQQNGSTSPLPVGSGLGTDTSQNDERYIDIARHYR